MLSMTGTGSARSSAEIGSARIQIAAVNNRGCRVSVRSDLGDLALDDRIRRRVQDALGRGSITVQVATEAAAGGTVDASAVAERWRVLADLAFELGAPAPTLADAMRAGGRGTDPEDDAARWTPLLDQALDEALDACQSMRAAEGRSLAAAFAEHHAALAAITQRLSEQAAPRAVAYAERLRERLAEILADRADIQGEHLVRELAIYADRIDVTEELVRLASHLDQLQILIAGAGEEAVGKRIEFLLQEIGRELNTTGAKANDAALQQTVIEGKHLVEQMKEQAANVV